MDKVTIIMPVSRPTFLDAMFSALEFLKCDPARTNLLVLVDGDNSLYVDVRNRVSGTKFNDKLCVQFKSKHTLRHFDILSRRIRISDIHNTFKQYIKEAGYIFGVEDDTVFPHNSLERLLHGYSINPHAGMIQGVTIGRHGISHLGAWQVNDVYDPTEINSIEATKESRGVIETDGCGFYCFLTRAEVYMAHDFKPFDNNNLGPDVEYSLSLRQQGYKNYTDLGLRCVHKTKGRDLSLNSIDPVRVTIAKQDNGRWRQKKPLTRHSI